MESPLPNPLPQAGEGANEKGACFDLVQIKGLTKFYQRFGDEWADRQIKKGGLPRPFELLRPELQAVIHGELDRMSGHAEAGNFFHLQFDESIDPVIGEHATTGQELAILVQVVQSLIQ